MLPRLGIVVPYRDREENLSAFVPQLLNFFSSDGLTSVSRLKLIIWQPCRLAIIDAMPGPNGVPSGISAGTLAVTRTLQQGQVARNNSTRVVIGLIGGMSI